MVGGRARGSQRVIVVNAARPSFDRRTMNGRSTASAACRSGHCSVEETHATRAAPSRTALPPAKGRSPARVYPLVLLLWVALSGAGMVQAWGMTGE